ncbi:siderophore-iron reductase FhuF [Heyndrickxia sporothermodurans]
MESCMVLQKLNDVELQFLIHNSALTSESAAEDSLLIYQESCGNLSMVIDELTERLQSPQKVITAAQLSKNYSFALIVPVLYAMTVFQKGIDASSSNAHVELSKEGAYSLHIKEMSFDGFAPSERNIWRDNILQKLFKDNLSLFHKSLSTITKIPESILWENVASYIYWLYESRLQQEDAMSPFTSEDFRYIVMDAPGSVFGKEYNPIKNCFKFIEKEDKTIVRIRKTCCLTYKLPGSPVFCGDCRLNPVNKYDTACKPTHIFG